MYIPKLVDFRSYNPKLVIFNCNFENIKIKLLKCHFKTYVSKLVNFESYDPKYS
jgi:hypothetical protein